MHHPKAKVMRDWFSEGKLAVGVGARDPLEALLVERAGFDFVWSSSLGVSASYAVPDASLISMSQYLDAARAMDEVISIPIIADCDTGYGNANNVAYAVKLFERAGIAAISLEDKRFPKDNSLLAGGRQELARIEEFAGKLQAAKDAQRSEEFIVIARVEALIAGWGQDEAMKRALEYVKAGADSILMHSKSTTPDEVVEFVRAWDGSAPLVLVPTTYPSLTEEAVRELGRVNVLIYANHPLRAAVKATEELLRRVKAEGRIDRIDEMMVPVSHIFELQGVPKMKEAEKRHLR